MNKIIDTHIHLDLKQYNKNLDEVINRAFEKGIEKMIIPGVKTKDIDKIIHIVDKYENIYFASGNHPNYLDDFDYSLIKEYASHNKCVSIGECGLDWYRIPNGSNINEIQKKQKEIFRKQIELSIELKKPLILHSRETDDDMVNVLMEYGKDLYGGVIHCYIGSEKLLELEKYNFYYGIGGVVTYKNAIELRNNLKKVPFHKFILETDGPYLTPQQVKYESKNNEPSFIPYIIKEISNLLKIDYNIIVNKAYNNTNRLFKF